MCLAIFFWATAEGLFKALSRYHYLEIMWFRYGVHLLFMTLMLSSGTKAPLLRAYHPGLQICRGLMMIGMPVFAMAGVQSYQGGDPIVFFQFSPLFVVLVAVLIFRESMTAYRWSFTCVAFGGTLLMLQPSTMVPDPGCLFLFGSALCFGSYQVLTRVLRVESWFTNLLYTALVVFVPISFFQPAIWITPTLIDGVLMAGIGLIGFGALWCLDRAYALAPAAAVAPFALTLPIWAALLRLAAGGPLKTPTLLGAVAVLASLTVLYLHDP